MLKGTSYISSLIFAAISDAKLGRAKTIIIGFIVYCIGYVMIILMANEKTHRSICASTNVTHNSVFSEHCGPQIIGILVFM
jgi:dipeptide/tripeptide permease